MTSKYVIDGLNTFMKGDNSPSINNDNILNWLYPIPPFEEQIRITKRISSLYSLLDEIMIEL
jgi:type I restriction enzyme S subunit